MWCSLLIVMSLGFDLLQYLVGTYRVDRFGRETEKLIKSETEEVQYPPGHPKPMNRLWLAKILFVSAAWLGLIVYIAARALSESLPAIGKS
jgi:hypothetical protein